MSTRSFIGRKLDNGNIEGIYCHFDGYLSWVGRILAESYSDPQKVANLLDLGDISSLHAEIAKTQFYGRDYGEENVQKRCYRDIHALRNAAQDAWWEYVYIFDEKWYLYRDSLLVAVDLLLMQEN